jgi:glycosyltransferase involved in cell wall biosynthesis
MLFVGDGPLRNNMTKLIYKFDLVEKVKMIKFVEHTKLPALINACKIFILTSEREALAVALMEAMACGIVPIVSDVGDLATVVLDKKNGLVVRSLDINGFTEAISFLINNPEKVKSMGKNAREIIIKEHSYESAIMTWSRILK